MEIVFFLKRHLNYDVGMEHDWANTYWLFRRMQEELKNLQQNAEQ